MWLQKNRALARSAIFFKHSTQFLQTTYITRKTIWTIFFSDKNVSGNYIVRDF